MNKIDQEFEQLARQINAKLKEATSALKEANELAGKANLPSLVFTMRIQEEEYYGEEYEDLDEKTPLERKFELIDVSELETEIERAGWSTSSSYC